MTKKRQTGVIHVRIPTTERGVDGFVKNIHDVFVAEKKVVFVGDHTVVARILCEVDPPVPSDAYRGSATLRIPMTDRGEKKFKRDLLKATRADKRITFSGEHDRVVKIFQERLVRHHITSIFIEMIEESGLPPWREPWVTMRPCTGRPSGRPYQSSFNAFRLNSVAAERGYMDPRWVTLEYAAERGTPIRVAERGRGVTVVRAYPNPVVVYNMEQCVGALKRRAKNRPVLRGAQSIADEYAKREKRLGLRISHAADATYNHFKDEIATPPIEWFRNPPQYYMTLFHEMAHSTGHYKRLGRREQNELRPFGCDSYGREELVAEIASCLIAMDSDVVNGALRVNPLVRKSASYLDDWLNAIKENPKWLWQASKEADRAYKYVRDKGFRAKARKQAIDRQRKKRKG